MCAACTGVATGQKLKKKMMMPKTTANALTMIPKIPGRWKGPQTSSLASPVSFEMSVGIRMAPVHRRHSRKLSVIT